MTTNNNVNFLYTELKQSCGADFEFRSHQIAAIDAAMNDSHGLFDITCGCGKTLIQACIIALKLNEYVKKGKSFKCLFVCHRLMLEDQIRTNYIKFFGNFFKRTNTKIKILNSTGDNSLEKVAKNDMNTVFGENVIYLTTTASINDYVKNHTTKLIDGKNVIAQKIFKQLDLYIHDEAHKEYSDALVKCVLNATKKAAAYFFTATPGEYLVKNLDTLSTCSFAEAVKANYIVKPVYYSIKVSDLVKLDANAEANAVINAFKHLKRNKKDANGVKEIPSLITFHDSVDNVRMIGDVINQYKTIHARFKANVYEIVSDKCISDVEKGKIWLAGIRLNGNRYNDGKLYSKSQILDILRKDHDAKIILNAFMLTEGIDLPEINGVLIACEKSDASLYQAISRGCRKTDNKENFFLYTLTENGLDNRVQNFIEELVKFTDYTFDFGGVIEDVNNGSDEDDDDNDDSTGVVTDIIDQIYTNINCTITKKKTEFDAFKVERNQIDKFKRSIKKANTEVDIVNTVNEYTTTWKDNESLLNDFCSAKAVLNYMK